MKWYRHAFILSHVSQQLLSFVHFLLIFIVCLALPLVLPSYIFAFSLFHDNLNLGLVSPPSVLLVNLLAISLSPVLLILF